MAQWYNGVFYTDKDEPKKDDEFIPHSIPRIEEYDENIEDIALKTNFDFAFIEKFSFKGLPTNSEEQRIFLESSNTLARESNPAGLTQDTKLGQQYLNRYESVRNAVKEGVVNLITGAFSLIPTRGKVNISTTSGGGRKTKKTRSQKNQKRTQRRLLAVDDR